MSTETDKKKENNKLKSDTIIRTTQGQGFVYTNRRKTQNQKSGIFIMCTIWKDENRGLNLKRNSVRQWVLNAFFLLM